MVNSELLETKNILVTRQCIARGKMGVRRGGKYTKTGEERKKGGRKEEKSNQK